MRIYRIAADFATFYSGTQIERLPSILQNGLLTNAAKNWKGDKSQGYIYITPSLETAHRYGIQAHREDKPLIIEMDIKKPRQLGKIEYDPMDRSENAWDDDGQQETIEEEEFRSIQRKIEAFIKTFFNINYYHLKSNFINDYEKGLNILHGFNLFNFILNELNQQLAPIKFQQLRPELKKKMVEFFKPGYLTDYIEITQNGTLRVSNEYFTMHSQYRIPRNIKPNEFKAIWVRTSDFPQIDLSKCQKTTIGAADLPDESRQRLEDKKSAIEYFDREKDKVDSENLDACIEEVNDSEDLEPEDKEIIIDVYTKIANNQPYDQYAISQLEEYVYENWGQEEVSNYNEFARIPMIETGKIKEILATQMQK